MSTVFVSKTKPGSVVTDYSTLLEKSGLLKTWPKNQPVVLKLNLSWTKFYPACSTPPWQLEGIISTLLKLGWEPEDIIPVENRTVVTDVVAGAQNHYWTKILAKYSIKMHFLTEEKYIHYHPKAKMLVLDQIFPQGILLPKLIIGKPIIHLPTMKTHVFTTTTGAIKNYFGMLNVNRHFAHRFIHQAITDLLQIQKEIHPQIFGVMDAAVVGSGPGPRAMEWHQKDYLLASDDLVALDSIAAKMMGFNPLKIDFLRLSQSKKLGIADPLKIEIVGESLAGVNFGFKKADTLASRGQKLIYHYFPPALEKLLLQTVIAPWSFLASKAYFDGFWYHFIGVLRIKKFLASPWGKVFKDFL